MPELPVVAAGSLLEFALSAPGFSMPLGRITYRPLEPLSFDEYLRAHSQTQLLLRLSAWSPGDRLGTIVHSQATAWYERYAMVGVMPAVVSADTEHGDPRRYRRPQTDLMVAYRDDFAKYTGRLNPHLIDLVLMSVAAQLGCKFVYSRAADGVQLRQTKRSLQLLEKSRLDTNPPSVMDVEVKTTQDQRVTFPLLSLPGHLLWRAPELLRSTAGLPQQNQG